MSNQSDWAVLKSIEDDFACHMGFNKKGRRKAKTCWAFVHQGTCNHVLSRAPLKEAIEIGGRYHPAEEEREYLRRKTNATP